MKSPASVAASPLGQAARQTALQEAGRNVVALVVSLILAAVGLGGWIVTQASQTNNAGFWGVSAASLLFWLAVTQGLVLVGAVIRVCHATWRYPITRMLDIASLFGVWLILLVPFVMAPMRAQLYGPMSTANANEMLGHHSMPGAIKLWRMAGQPHTPQDIAGTSTLSLMYDLVPVLAAYLAGFAILFLTSLPDRAARAGKPVFGWVGEQRQWGRLRRAEGFLIVAAIISFFCAQATLGWDFQMAAGAHWDSSIFPFQVSLTGLMAGFAAAVLIMTIHRRQLVGAKGTLERQYDAIGKTYIGLGLLFFYFRWCDFVTAWFGHTPDEWHVQVTRVQMFPILFGLMVLGCVLVPIFANIWKGVRTNPVLISAISLLMLVGIFCQKFLDIVPAFWPHYAADTMMGTLQNSLIGGLAGFLLFLGLGALLALTYGIFAPIFGWVSWWGQAKWLSRSTVQKRGNAEVTVMIEDAPVWEN